MQSALRAVNIILSPALTLLFASRLEGLTIGGEAAAGIVGGAVAGLVVLVIETALTQGPKYSPWLRRWLDPRAAFEGVWIQDVLAGQSGNNLGLFFLDYEQEGDSFAVLGYAYSDDGRRWATWNSEHMFIDTARLKATYLWKGELLAGDTPEPEKSGLTDLDLVRPPAFSLPMTGNGRVWHVGEGTRVTFLLRRVTNQLLAEFHLPFTIRELRTNARDEQGQLVQACLRQKKPDSAQQPATAGA